MFPIKYIDNNLVWNKDNEVFAYYELIPYNYSFLSAEQKFIVHDSFRQLIAQSREGKIHALQIATESSIRSMQEQSKKLVTGKLKEVAYQKIDEQTEALVSMIGDNQVDYRFFLGFKLMVTEEQLNLKNIKKSAWLTFTEFLHEVNHTLMNDFVSMPNDEINRYMKMEKLLENKISRRFKVRRLEINDFGYLMEHLYGRDGIAYEDYEYQLPKKELKKETLIKYYDLIRPTRCVIEESQRYLRLEHEDKESYVSYFTVNAIVGELDFPSSEIFYFQQQQFTFPVDTSMNVEIVENRKALTTVRNKKKELKDLDNHAYQAGSETSSNVVDALDSVDELETDLDQSKESMYKLSYVIRVSAPDLDELKRRCDEVKDFYDDLNVKLVRPAGDMLGLHSEFLPASKRYINDYVQYVKSDFLAGLGFGATQQLGETTGIYMGYSVDTGRNVYLQPSLASQGVKGTVTNALASAFVGSLGGGKSFCNNLLVYYSVLFGGQAVILDPKAERGNWKETLPEIAHEINIVNLTSDKDNAGLLDPFVIMKNVKDAESLAIDILTFLTGISSRDGEKFPVLRKAVRSVTQSDSRGLLHVIDELRREDTPISRNIADHIDSFTDYDFAHLLFSDGTVENAISLDNQLNIIQVADLVLPDKDTTFEEYTTIELLSVSMLIVISTFALDFIHSDRSIFKIVDLDEAWAFLNVAQGETLSNKHIKSCRKELHDQNTYDGTPKSSFSSGKTGSTNNNCCDSICFISISCRSNTRSNSGCHNNTCECGKYTCQDINRTDDSLRIDTRYMSCISVTTNSINITSVSRLIQKCEADNQYNRHDHTWNRNKSKTATTYCFKRIRKIWNRFSICQKELKAVGNAQCTKCTDKRRNLQICNTKSIKNTKYQSYQQAD